MKQKINLRLSFIALIAIVATAIGTTVMYYSLFQSRVTSDLVANATLLMETDLFQTQYAEAEGDPAQIDTKPLEKLLPGELRITWVDQDGTVLFDNDTDAVSLANHMDRPEIQQAFATGSGASMRRSDTFHMNNYYYAIRLEDGTVLRLSTRAHNITSVFLSVMPIILVIAAVILAMCILLGHALTGQLLKPLEQMAESLEDDRETPVYPELQPLAEKIRTQHENILAAAKSRQDFTANVSHELKTPLTAISGYAELIENRMVDVDGAVHMAGQIRQNAARLLNLINDIIRLSELDHFEIPRKFESVDLYEIAKDCCRNLQSAAEQRLLTLTCQGSCAPLFADGDLLRELVENLVQNALRYNREFGTVTVTVEVVGSHPVLTVEDTGIGIPSDQQDRVFERFYRVDKSRSRETGGTGLGLAIVKHIADLHHAEIKLTSTLQIGTTITVRF